MSPESTPQSMPPAGAPETKSDAPLLERLLDEGYVPSGGRDAWHGPDFAAAIAGVDVATAFWRPAPGRHNIAEIALHHAYYQHAVRARLSSAPIEPFPLEGDDWFPADEGGALSWSAICDLCARLQRELKATVRATAEGRDRSDLDAAGRFDQVLGVTAHAVYHAGQILLLRRLREADLAGLS